MDSRPSKLIVWGRELAPWKVKQAYSELYHLRACLNRGIMLLANSCTPLRDG